MSLNVPRVAPADAPAIGQYWEGQGGIYAGIMPDYVGTEPKHLIFSVDEAVDLTWGGFGLDDSCAASAWDGAANTACLTAPPHRHAHDAAKWANDYEKDGHRDFHLPSRLELGVAFETIADRFDRRDWYWSSTQRSERMAYGRSRVVNEDETPSIFKAITGRVRAVRTILA
jgi:hypothetical protein